MSCKRMVLRCIIQHRRVGGAYGRGNDRIPICDVELYRCDPADIKAHRRCAHRRRPLRREPYKTGELLFVANGVNAFL